MSVKTWDVGQTVDLDDYRRIKAENAALKAENERLADGLSHHMNISQVLADGNANMYEMVMERDAEIELLKARVEELEHAANEWADACINGLQHLKNIRDGYSIASEVLPNVESCIAHCQSVWSVIKEPANEG